MQFARAFGPAVGRVPWTEAVRAGLGALVGLGVAGLFLLSPSIDLQQGLFLMAPFGASSVLLFAVPNSPLAQPWSAIVGNIVSALVAISICLLLHDPVLKVAVAVCAAIAVMILCRALHPPGGAVAMTAALNPDLVDKLGYYYAIAPVGVGTCALVVIAMVYAHLTGRRYPFRQFDEPSKHATHDRNPSERLGLSQDELADILSQYRQSFNLGVEDLARLIGAAEIQAAAHKSGPLCVGDLMSTDLICVAPDTPVAQVLDLFKQHRFTSLPVVGDDQQFLGVIFQMDVIDHFKNSMADHMRGIASQAGRLFRIETATAQNIMQNSVPMARASDSIGSLLPLMADGAVDAVPVLDGHAIIGIATRTDLIAGLTRMAARRDGG
jgi:CBS domain-containing membrane protein